MSSTPSNKGPQTLGDVVSFYRSSDAPVLPVGTENKGGVMVASPELLRALEERQEKRARLGEVVVDQAAPPLPPAFARTLGSRAPERTTGSSQQL